MWHTNAGPSTMSQADSGSARDEWTLRWGFPEPPQAPRPLRAGPLALGLAGSDLMDVRLGERQLLSRLGVKVRDTAWGNVPGAVSQVEVEVGSGCFEARLTSEHRSPELAVRWEGVLSGAADGTLVYEMRGTALEDSAFNRIGICLLHSATTCAGRPFRARGPDGEHHGVLPLLVGPQPMEGETIFPMFPGFSELEIDLGDSVRLRFELAGDVFEMEDQRNWTDGSFKTYSTPVGSPTPHRLSAGARLSQRARVQLRGVCTSHGRARRDAVGGAGVRLLGPAGTRVPRLGAELDSDGHEPTPAELARLRCLRPSHLRVSLSSSTAREQLRRARRVADDLGCRLELALTIPRADAVASLSDVAAILAGCRGVDRVIVLEEGRRVTSPAVVSELRRRLGAASSPPLVGGTDMYFAEVNRDRPDMDALDGVAYPITPQVHDDDEPALVESLAAQAATVATARSFSAGKPVHVSPVTLKPRLNPFARELGGTPAGDLPAAVDPRQPSLFAAAWTVGSIHRLAEAGAASVTYFELTGWRGLTERQGGSPRPERFRSRPGTAYPVLSVMAEACRWVGAELVDLELGEPLAVEALAVCRGNVTMLLVANLRPVPQRVQLAGLAAGAASTWFLDPRNPDGLSAAGSPARIEGGRLVLDLDAWSVGRVLVPSAP